MIINRLNELQLRKQEKVSSYALDLLYAAQMMLIEIDFDHEDLKKSQQACELKTACKNLTNLFMSKEGV